VLFPGFLELFQFRLSRFQELLPPLNFLIHAGEFLLLCLRRCFDKGNGITVFDRATAFGNVVEKSDQLVKVFL